jgi:hypothetical protein
MAMRQIFLSRLQEGLLKAILTTPLDAESIFDDEYLCEFEAKKAKALKLVLETYMQNRFRQKIISVKLAKLA